MIAILAGLIAWLGVQTAEESVELHGGEDPIAADHRSRNTGPIQRRKTDALLSISGSVHEVDGAAVIGASICARPDLRTAPAAADACAESDASGRYSIAGLSPARHRVFASARGFLPESLEEEIDPSAAPSDVDFVLERGGALVRGRIVDRGGGPIAGAAVSAGSVARDCSVEASGTIARSDDRGAYELWAAAGSALIRAEADGYVAAYQSTAVPGMADLELVPESSLSGKVIELKSGAAVPNVTVQVTARAFRASCFGVWKRAAVTNADGRFTIGALAEGRYLAEVAGDGWRGRAREPTTLEPVAAATDVLVEVERAHRIAGRIVLAGSGAPCAKGRVAFGGEEEHAARTRDDGRFSFDAVSTGEYELRFDCDGGWSARTVRVESDIADLVLTASAAVGAIVKGRTIDDTGAPIANVQVILQRPGITWIDSTASDDLGFFELSVPWSGSAQVSAFRRGFAEGAPVTRTLAVGAEAEPLTLVLQRAGAIHGRVVTMSGEPVQRATVSLGPRAASPSITDDEGRFQLDDVPPGNHQVHIKRNVQPLVIRSGPDAIEVRAGATAEATLVVDPLDGSIEGRVFDPSGAPVANARVQLRKYNPAARSGYYSGYSEGDVQTDEDGRFAFAGLAPGDYTVAAVRAGVGAGSIDAIATGKQATITLTRYGSLSGRVEVAGQKPPETFAIELSGQGAPTDPLSFTRTEGRFRIDDLIAGDYVVEAKTAVGKGTANARVEAGGETKDLMLSIEAPTTVRGRLIDMDSGDPAAGVAVWIDSEALDRDFNTISRADGSFELERIPVGSIGLTAAPPRGSASTYLQSLPILIALQPIPINELAPIYVRRNPLRDGEVRGLIGITVGPSRYSAVIVDRVSPGSPAERAGVKPGDEITHVNDADVSGTNAYQFIPRAYARVGQQVEIRLRTGRVLRMTAEAP